MAKSKQSRTKDEAKQPVKPTASRRERARRFQTSTAWMNSDHGRTLGAGVFVYLTDFGFSEDEAMAITTNVLLTAWQYVKL